METLFTPAHLHIAINHVPIIGLAVSCLPVLIGILFHSRGALASGLLAVILCAGFMPAIMETGEAAQESFVDGSIDPGMDVAGKAAFREHSHRAKATAPVVYAAGILAAVSLLALIRFPRQAAWIGWAVLLGCALSVGLSVWTAEAGGRIRHAEFRPAEKSSTKQPLQATPTTGTLPPTPPSSPHTSTSSDSPSPTSSSSQSSEAISPIPSPTASPSGSPISNGLPSL